MSEQEASAAKHSQKRPAGRLRGSRAPLVGRDREFALLLEVLRAPSVDARGVFLVSGEPGAGKSRLLAEVSDHARALSWHVLFGHAYDSEGMPPYLPFVEALGAYLRSMPGAGVLEGLGATAHHLALLLPDLRLALPRQTASPALDPESQRYHLFEAISDLLLNIARSSERGLLLCLDDLHWADESTLLLLEHVLRRLADEPLVVLVAYRETELDVARPLARTLEQLARQRAAQRIELRRLGREDLRTLFSALGPSSPPDTIVDAVYRETEGNPFFVHEVYEYLAEEQRLFNADGQWRTDLRISEFDVPQSIRLVIGRRLERLSETCRRVLRDAAVLGRGFAFELLRRVSDIEESALLDAIDEATAAGLVTSDVDGQSFTHELIRQTLLSGLSLPRRQRLELRAAHAIIALYGAESPQHAGETVGHFRMAGAAADPEEAVGYFLKAGQSAERVFAWEDAGNYYRSALELLEAAGDRDPATEVDLLQALILVLLPAGQGKQILEEVAPRAYALAQVLGDSERMGAVSRAAVEAGYSEWGPVGVASPEGHLWLARADENTSGTGRERLLTDARSIMAHRIDYSPRYWPFAQKTYAEAEASGDLEAILVAACYGPLVLGAPPIEGVDDMRRALQRVKELPRTRASLRTRGAFLRQWIDAGLVCGDRASFDAGLEELSVVVDQLNDTFMSEELWSARVHQCFLDGAFPEVLRLFHTRMQAAPKPADYPRFFALGIVTRVLLLTGEQEAARRLLLEEIPPYYANNVPPAWRTIRAFFHASVGEVEPARRDMDHWLRLERVNASSLINEMAGAMEAALALGDWDLARRLVPLAGRLAGLPLCGWQAYASPGRLLAAAARFDGDQLRARHCLESALAATEGIRFRPESAMVRLDLADLLHQYFPNDAPAASAHLEAAIVELDAMGMQPALSRAHDLEVRMHATSSAQNRHPMGLSERQIEVLRLAAAGKSNQEIAEELVLSIRTVERHISDSYSKIGARNRVEAAAFVLNHLSDPAE